jgi:hypothetical protein
MSWRIKSASSSAGSPKNWSAPSLSSFRIARWIAAILVVLMRPTWVEISFSLSAA